MREIDKYKLTPIIFVTSLIGGEADLLKTIHCYDYIEKPLGDGKIAISKILNAIEAIQSRPIPKRVEYIPLHYDGIRYMLAVKDIICIENKKGVLYVYLKDEKIEIPRISLKKAGGQLQRIAIARALLKKPDVLILDEATSMLDPRGRKEINELVKELKKQNNMTIISITHDIEEAKNADRVILLNKGEIVDCDKPQKILTNEKLLKELKLDIPFSLKIARKLQKKGYQIKDTLDVEELEKQLCQLHAKV